MISCNLMGGLGNYLFQIGASYSLAKENGDNLVLDYDNALQVHKSIKRYNTNILRKVDSGDIRMGYNIYHSYQEGSFTYNKIPYQKDMMVNGYFQSEKYLNRDLVLDLFSLDEDSEKYIYEKYGKILKKENTISIHVRRGDYLDKEDRHPVCRMDYYESAIKCFVFQRELPLEFPTFLVFSDDIEWCKKHFKGDNYIFIENEEDYIDLYLMTLCKHNIIANSSFSWWGAWLNKNENKEVVAPKKWFGINKNLPTDDIIPKEWIVV